MGGNGTYTFTFDGSLFCHYSGRRGTVAIVWDPPSSRNYRLYYAGDAYTYADASGTFWLRNR